ncbi:MAG: alpha/beta hydrolase family protein [Planctomycetota bacterium]|jgi:cephalosporin-C deacetylase-like acetyl esterase
MRTLLCLAFLLVSLTPLQAADDLRVLTESTGYTAPGTLLKQDLKQQVNAALDARLDKLNAITSHAECEAWARERREFFVKQIGGFPERTPLNAKVVRHLKGNGYRVENVIFESRPGHHVTANLYLPDGPGPFPGVLIPCGHSHNGKAAGGYQRASILLAKHGMAAMCYDPIGQGERYQMLDFEHEHEHFSQVSYPLPVPHPRVQYLCTTEHTAMGVGCILLGTNIAQFRIWDGMRAIDYLQSRKDIIADRIGCTGNSGGGTLTAYLMALDDRIVAAAPVCYLTTFRKLIETKGPQDGEQNIFGQIAFGMDEPDYVMMRAPRPTLICAGRRDSTFNIDGTWDLFRQAKSFYSRMGYPERVDINDADVPHGFYLQQREAAARFMHRWLVGQDKVIQEVDPASLPDPISDKQLRELGEGDWTQEELYCTPDGQTLLMDGAKSVFQINAEIAHRLKTERTATWNAMSELEKRDVIRETISARPLNDLPHPVVRTVDSVKRDGYSIEKLILTQGSSIPLPALAFVPNTPNGSVTLYLHGTSMATDAASGGPIEKLVRSGQIVVAAELRGIGETDTGFEKRDWGRGRFGHDVQEILLAYLSGRSYVGMRVDDVAVWSRYVARRWNVTPKQMHLVATGEAAVPALHAAALQTGTATAFETITLRGMISSWEDVVRATDNHDQLVNAVHGALRHYDLPDLVDLVGRQRVLVDAPVNAVGNPLSAKKQP